MGFDLELLLGFFTEDRVVAVDLRHAGRSLLAADCIERKSITLPAEMLDLRFTETSGHVDLLCSLASRSCQFSRIAVVLSSLG